MSEVDAIISELSGASQLTIDMWTDDKAVVSESAIGRQRQFERLGLATFGRQTEVVRWSDTGHYGRVVVGVPTELGRAVRAQLACTKHPASNGDS